MSEAYRLTAGDVAKVFEICAADDGKPLPFDEEMLATAFDPQAIQANRCRIAQMLGELPMQFRADVGGGWSFLNACLDRHGNQWTDLHSTMAKLFGLGVAAGLADFVFPPLLWSSLPGGMPYFVIADETDLASAQAIR